MRKPILTTEINVEGVDSGFATLGVAVVRGDPARGVGGARILHLAFHATKKASKTARKLVRVSTDDRTRIEDMGDAVAEAADRYGVRAIGFEWFMPNPKQKGFASGGWKAAISVGAIVRIAQERRIAALDQLPVDVKMLVGNRSASKAEVEEWLREHLAGFSEAIDKISPSHREHPSDAAAHALVALLELAVRRREAAL